MSNLRKTMCETLKIFSKIHYIPGKNPTTPSARQYLVYKYFRTSQDFLEMKMLHFKELETDQLLASCSRATLFILKKPSSGRDTGQFLLS